MTTDQTLQSYLSTQLNVKTSSFWDGLKNILESESCLNDKMTNKTKLILIDAIRSSITSEEWKIFAPTIILLLGKISDTSYLDQNFTEEDSSFFTALEAFASFIFEKKASDDIFELKNEILTLYDSMLSNNSIIKQKELNGIVKSIINMFKNIDEDQSLYARTLAFIYHLISKSDSLAPVIQENSQTLFDAAKEIQSPKTQMQLFNILWIVQARVKEASFIHKEDAPFISTVHKISSKINNGIKAFIISLQFQNAKLPDGAMINSGWIDIGISDLIFCFDEKIMAIPFDSIGGLDHENTIFTIFLDENFKDFGDNHDHKITVKLSKKPTSKMITSIFSRISRGESQPMLSDQEDENFHLPPPGPAQQAPYKTPPSNQTEPPRPQAKLASPAKNHNSVVHISVPAQTTNSNAKNLPMKNVKSSVAMYIGHEAQMQSYSSQIDENLFIDFKSSANSTEPPQTIETSIPELSNENELDNDSVIPESPPPPSIDMNMSLSVSMPAEASGNESNDDNYYEEDSPQVKNKKGRKSKNSKNKTSTKEEPANGKPQIDLTHDDLLFKHTSIVSERICAGIDALTKQRMDCVDHFGQQIIRYVDSFKDDIKSAEKDKEHCSVKQLELSKQKFQNNIQQFKKKEASIQQTLAGIEEETKQFSSKITEIQRKMRGEIQKHRLDLEKQLKNLRKMIREDDRPNFPEGDSSDLNEDYEEFIPISRGKFQIVA